MGKRARTAIILSVSTLLCGLSSMVNAQKDAAENKIPGLKRATISVPNITSVQKSKRHARGQTQVRIQLDGKDELLILEPVHIRGKGFAVLIDEGDGQLKLMKNPPPSSVYKGAVAGKPGSKVTASIREGVIDAVVRTEAGEFFIQPKNRFLKSATPDHIVYSGADVEEDVSSCATEGQPLPVAESGSGSEAPVTAKAILPGTKIAEIAFDTDYEFYVANGSSISNTIADIEMVMAGVNSIYEDDVQITHQLGTIIVRSDPADPYAATTADGILGEFQNEWNSNQVAIARDVAHIMTGKNVDGSTIGLAYIGVICNGTYGYGISESRYTSIVARRFALTSHELGHNWNAGHCSCNVMCSSIGGCTGILDTFTQQSIDTISNYRDTRTCLDTEPGNQPDLVLAQSVGPELTGLDETYTYSLIVSNAGLATATSVELVDTLPVGATVMNISPGAPDCLQNGASVTCTLADLAPGFAVTVDIDLRNSSAGWVTNTASVSCYEIDLDLSDNYSALPFRVLPDFSVSPDQDWVITGAQGGPFSSFGRIFTLRNLGAGTLTWSASSDVSWLSLATTTGILGPGETLEITPYVNGEANALAEGLYNGHIMFVDEVAGETNIVQVSIELFDSASVPFTEDFETGLLSDWWTTSSTQEGQILVTTLNGPGQGATHLTMDDTVDGSSYSRNELTLTVNLAGYGNVQLSYMAREWGDEPHGPPAIPYTGSADYDGVAISEDGEIWYEVQGLRAISSSYNTYTVDLDASIGAHGLSYNSAFQIRFTQFDNYGINADGIALDNIQISGAMPTGDQDNNGLEDAWEIQYFGASGVADPLLDIDGDGLTVGQEFTADTHPLSASSILQANILPSGSGLDVTFSSSENRMYTIECKTNLFDSGWTILTNQMGTGGAFIFPLPLSGDRCFYRVGVNLP